MQEKIDTQKIIHDTLENYGCSKWRA